MKVECPKGNFFFFKPKASEGVSSFDTTLFKNFKAYPELVSDVDEGSPEPLQAAGRLLVLAVEDEVRGRLGYEEGADEEHRRGYGDQKGALTPVQVGAGYVRQQDADVTQHLQHRRQTAAYPRQRDLRYVHLRPGAKTVLVTACYLGLRSFSFRGAGWFWDFRERANNHGRLFEILHVFFSF